MATYTDVDKKCAHVIRTLTLDAIQKANSGHPGMPLGMADAAYVLYSKFMKFNPKDPKWFDRDRFIISAGHGSMLVYSLLHLTGYDLTLDELKQFRQLGSRTPGHPENILTPGVEVTTGPLGAGTSNSVGMAMAEKWLAARFNRDDHTVIDHYTYAIVSDGDLQEGISHEAASLAGHLGLNKLIWLYDDNEITIDGATSLSWSDDVTKRFTAYGWRVLSCDAHDLGAVEKALRAARRTKDRPTIIRCKAVIGYGMPNRQGTSKAHSDPPGAEEIRLAKQQYGLDPERDFYIPDDILTLWRGIGKKAARAQARWKKRMKAYQAAEPALAEQLQNCIDGILPEGWDAALPVFKPGDKALATRAASGKVINAICCMLPQLLGGAADLTPSNKTKADDAAPLCGECFSGQYVHYGIREHGMGGIMNGMALHGGVIPFGGTFHSFSDYMRPAIRLAALSQAHVIFVFTHDSIGVGEDGPTHQPVEQTASLRAIPELLVIRPADANETVVAWQVALKARRPVALLLSRQGLPILPHNGDAARGAYVVRDAAQPDVLLLSAGSEVSLALDGAEALAGQGIKARVVSMPCWELFEEQDDSYQADVLPAALPKVVIEAGVRQGWERYGGANAAYLTIERFGASAPAEDVYRDCGLTVENLVATTKALLGK